MNKFIFLGAPGAGKGTMAEKLSATTTIQHISTGAILREEISGGTELGNAVKGYMDRGELVPDEVVAKIVAGALATDEAKEQGFILDGFPRTENQAAILADLLKENSVELDAVILFEVPDETLMARLTGRRVCKACGSTLHHMVFNPPKTEGTCDKCGGELYQRKDDNEATAADRLEVYKEQTMPVISFYQNSGKLVNLDSTGTQDEVFAGLQKLIQG